MGGSRAAGISISVFANPGDRSCLGALRPPSAPVHAFGYGDNASATYFGSRTLSTTMITPFFW
jgi:hypothetical protein